jgi:hypothetical protein
MTNSKYDVIILHKKNGKDVEVSPKLMPTLKRIGQQVEQDETPLGLAGRLNNIDPALLRKICGVPSETDLNAPAVAQEYLNALEALQRESNATISQIGALTGWVNDLREAFKNIGFVNRLRHPLLLAFPILLWLGIWYGVAHFGNETASGISGNSGAVSHLYNLLGCSIGLAAGFALWLLMRQPRRTDSPDLNDHKDSCLLYTI